MMDGEYSLPASVLLGVPQLGNGFRTIDVSYLYSEQVSSPLRLFADNCLLFTI